MQFFKKHRAQIIPLICIAGVSLFAVMIFLSPGYPGGQDLGYHAASIFGLSKRSFFEILTSKIYGCVANDLGYGEGLFYPPFAHVATAMIYKAISSFGFSVFTAMKIFYFFVLLFSGIFMRKFILLITKNDKAALFASFFYITTPYFLTDIFLRAAMAESTLFIFMPVVLIGIYYLLQDEYRKFLPYFTIGCIGLIHSHLMLTMFFVIITILGFLPNIKLFFRKKKILYFLLSVALTIIISLPFLVPLAENRLNANYHVFEPNFMTSVERIEEHSMPPATLFSLDGSLDNVTGFLSFFSVLFIFGAIVLYRKVKTTKNAAFVTFAIIASLVSIICSTSLFPWKYLPEPLLLIQFPWRLCSFIVLGGAICLGAMIPLLEKKSGELTYLFVGLACLFNLFWVNSYIPNVAYFDQNTLYTHPTYDYLPTVIPSDLDYVLSQPQNPTASDAEVVISDYESNVPDLSFNISHVSRPTTITLPRYYYLGYQINAIYQDGADYHLPYTMSEHGLISFEIEKDAHIEVHYPGTPLQRSSYAISGITILLCAGYLVKVKIANHRPK